MITCKACGTQNPPDAVYCSNCARKLDPETQNAIVAQREAHTATGLRWSNVAIAATVLVIVLVLVLLFVTHVL